MILRNRLLIGLGSLMALGTAGTGAYFGISLNSKSAKDANTNLLSLSPKLPESQSLPPAPVQKPIVEKVKSVSKKVSNVAPSSFPVCSWIIRGCVILESTANKGKDEYTVKSLRMFSESSSKN